MLWIEPKAARSAWAHATVFAVVLLSLYTVFLIRQTLLVFAIALMFAYLLYPLVEAIDHRFPLKTRTPALVLPFVLILGLLTGFGLLIREPLHRQADQLRAQMSRPDFKLHLAEWEPLGLPVGEEIAENYSRMLGMIPQVSEQLSRGLKAVVRDTLNLFIVPLLSFFILKDGLRIRDSLLEIFNIDRNAAQAVLRDAHTLMLDYMRSLLILCLATLITFTVALSLMGVKYAILLSLVAFPLEFIPLVGPLISAVIIIGTSEFNKYPHLAWIVAFLAAYRIFQDYVLSPHLMRKGVKLHPMLVMFGVFAGGEIGGVPGIFLSVPVLALVRLVYYESRKRRNVAADPVPVEKSCVAISAGASFQEV